MKDTADNLKTAIEGEGHEFKTMYPGFLEEAVAAVHDDIALIEQGHDIFDDGIDGRAGLDHND